MYVCVLCGTTHVELPQTLGVLLSVHVHLIGNARVELDGAHSAAEGLGLSLQRHRTRCRCRRPVVTVAATGLIVSRRLVVAHLWLDCGRRRILRLSGLAEPELVRIEWRLSLIALVLLLLWMLWTAEARFLLKAASEVNETTVET